MSEIRLIDANALKEDLRRYFTDGVLDGVSARLAFNQILHDIENAPTVEERPQENLIVSLTELCNRYCKDCPVTAELDIFCTDCICTRIRGIIGEVANERN